MYDQNFNQSISTPLIPCGPNRCILYARCNTKIYPTLTNYLNNMENFRHYVDWVESVLIMELFEPLIQKLNCEQFSKFFLKVIKHAEYSEHPPKYIEHKTIQKARLITLDQLSKENLFPKYMEIVGHMIQIHKDTKPIRTRMLKTGQI